MFDAAPDRPDPRVVDGSEDAVAVPVEALGALDLVTEVDDMITVFAAQRYVRVDRMCQAAVAEALGFGRPVVEIAVRSLRLELAAALRVSEYAADALIFRAEALVHRYPGVLESMSRARVTERHGMILIETLDAVEPGLRADLVARAVELAETQPVGQFRRSLRKLVESARSDTLAARHEAALAGRRIGVESAGDGMAWTTLYGPEVEAHAIFGRLTAMGHVLAEHPDETRTLDQLRADIAADLLIDGGASVHPASARGIRATVAVTVPALSLLETNVAGADNSGGMRRWSKVSGRSRFPGRGNCAGVMRGGCGC